MHFGRTDFRWTGFLQLEDTALQLRLPSPACIWAGQRWLVVLAEINQSSCDWSGAENPHSFKLFALLVLSPQIEADHREFVSLTWKICLKMLLFFYFPPFPPTVWSFMLPLVPLSRLRVSGTIRDIFDILPFSGRYHLCEEDVVCGVNMLVFN